MASKKQQKQVQVLCRYAHKKDGQLNGIVTYCVRSSNGKDFYYTTLINGKASGCGCPSHKPCYHMTQLEAREAARKPVVEKTTPAISLPIAYQGSHKTMTVKGDLLPKRDMMTAAINRQGFHLMR